MLGGLSAEDVEAIRSFICQFPEIEEVWLFGSRAKGSYKKGSDVDLALKGKDLGSVVIRIQGWLNDESLMPYYFDILDYQSITNQELRDHIDSIGILFWKGAGSE